MDLLVSPPGEQEAWLVQNRYPIVDVAWQCYGAVEAGFRRLGEHGLIDDRPADRVVVSRPWCRGRRSIV